MRYERWARHYEPELSVLFKVLMTRHPKLRLTYHEWGFFLFKMRNTDTLN